MTDYLYPVGDVPVSCSWQCHSDRTPPSAEPGTDYACAYGTAVLAPDDGTVTRVQSSPSGASGRRVELALTDGRSVDLLHLSEIRCSPGQRVTRGQQVAVSGASGYGSDWYYGPHTHASLFDQQPISNYADSIDFDAHAGGDTPTPPNLEDREMFMIESLPDRGRAIIGAGYFRQLHNNEELTEALQLVTKTLYGNARQWDVWKSLAVGGSSPDEDAIADIKDAVT